jgi:hypothetical protein
MYEVWMEFTELNDVEKQFLDRLKNELATKEAAF